MGKLEKILLKIEQAKNEGGKIITGGNRLKLNGNLKNGYCLPR